MKTRLLIASFIAALTASFAAMAADAPATDNAAPAEKPAMAKHKAKPHSHAEANKQGVAPPENTEPAAKPKKPLHEHQKVHK